MSKIDDKIREYDLYRERDGLTDEVLDAYVQSISYLMFTEKNIEEGLALANRVKGYAFDTIHEKTGADFWTLEKYCQDNELRYNIVDEVYKIWLMESYYKFESYIFYLEKNRAQDKRFYLPRMSVLHKVMGDLEDLVNRKIKFLGISLPSRTGKALSYDTPILTRNGWKNHGDLTIRDEVIGLDGKFKKILAIHNPCDMEYKVTFSDHDSIICHGNHEWVVFDRHTQQNVTIETKEMLGKEMDKDGHKRFTLPWHEQVVGEEKNLVVDPYTLGVWLGDGRNNNPDVCMAESDYPVVQKILENGYELAWQTKHKTTGVRYYGFKELRQQLQTFDMCHSRRRVEKHIPDDYLTASKEQRLWLLAGLLDTDGSLSKKEHRYHFTTAEERLRDSFIALVHTFGWRTSVSSYAPKTSSSGVRGRKTFYVIAFNPTEYIPCQLERKQLKEYSKQRGITIESIEPIEGYKGNCITVEDGIYLAGRTLKPTHNSTLCIFFLTWVAMRNPESNSAMGGHSGVLVKGFYDELMNVIGTEEYTFPEIYFTWHKTKDLIQNKSAEYKFINLGNPNRFATLTCRGIDETWTGAVNISWDGILYVDDLVRDREHSLSPSRMENTWQEYLNKMTDRKSGVDAEGFAGSCELMVGTLWNVYDPLYRMELLHIDDPLYRFRKIPALNENDETNFPYQYTTEYLHEMRERLDAPEWMAKWQQAPFVREGILIGENELNYFNGEVGEKPKKYIAVLDPAVGGGDYLSMVIIADGKKKYIIDWVYTKETKGKSIPEICRKVIFHNVTEIHYEKNGIGRVFDDEVTKELHKMGYYRCKMIPFTAPEGMSKEEKIIGYSDWIKGNLWFIEEGAKSTTYARSTQYQLALNHVFIYTSVGKNKTDDAIDNLAQVARMYEKQSNGTIDVILNPFR